MKRTIWMAVLVTVVVLAGAGLASRPGAGRSRSALTRDG